MFINVTSRVGNGTDKLRDAVDYAAGASISIGTQDNQIVIGKDTTAGQAKPLNSGLAKPKTDFKLAARLQSVAILNKRTDWRSQPKPKRVVKRHVRLARPAAAATAAQATAPQEPAVALARQPEPAATASAVAVAETRYIDFQLTPSSQQIFELPTQANSVPVFLDAHF